MDATWGEALLALFAVAGFFLVITLGLVLLALTPLGGQPNPPERTSSGESA
jgi:hypothetical protein